jgi:hypothetical protein
LPGAAVVADNIGSEGVSYNARAIKEVVFDFRSIGWFAIFFGYSGRYSNICERLLLVLIRCLGRRKGG